MQLGFVKYKVQFITKVPNYSTLLNGEHYDQPVILVNLQQVHRRLMRRTKAVKQANQSARCA